MITADSEAEPTILSAGGEFAPTTSATGYWIFIRIDRISRGLQLDLSSFSLPIFVMTWSVSAFLLLSR
jgi:hypothetical protein